MRTLLSLLVAVASFISLTGCSTTSGPTAANRSGAQFLDEVSQSPQLQGKAVGDLYPKIYFAPVTVRKLKEQNWWTMQGTKTQAQLAEDANKLALYMRASFIKAARTYPGARLTVVDKKGPGVVIVESAITELIPAKAYFNAAASAAGFVVPGAGLLGAFGKGAIGFEGRLLDGKSGAVVATFRHNEKDRFAALNVASYTLYRGSKIVIDDVAAKFAKVFNSPAGTYVTRSSPIQLVAF